MLQPARNIWDTRIQCVCAVVSAAAGGDVELWMCGNFSQASLDPPRIVINPNVLYPIESTIRESGRFAVNVFSAGGREAVLRMVQVRRREPEKAKVLGLPVIEDAEHHMPYIPDAMQTLFCELEQALDTSDHTVMIGRVVG